MRLRSEGLSTRNLAGNLVILDINRSQYLQANATGTELLHLLEEGADFAVLEDALVERYGVDRASATSDVETFLGDLRSADLLTESA